MAGTSLLALLDDIATVLDDVAVMTKVAAKKTAGVLDAALVIVAQPLLPWALGFAAGAMIFVVVEEVIPESQNGPHNDLATMGTIVGFVVMMVMDVALG